MLQQNQNSFIRKLVNWSFPSVFSGFKSPAMLFLMQLSKMILDDSWLNQQSTASFKQRQNANAVPQVSIIGPLLLIFGAIILYPRKSQWLNVYLTAHSLIELQFDRGVARCRWREHMK